MVREWKGREPKKGGKKKNKEPRGPPEINEDEITVYYDGSGRPDIQQGGSGSIVIVEGEEFEL